MSREEKPSKRKYERPITLHPMTFNQAIDKLLLAKPDKPKKKSPTSALPDARPRTS